MVTDVIKLTTTRYVDLVVIRLWHCWLCVRKAPGLYNKRSWRFP